MEPFHNDFLTALRERYPVKTELANALAELLHIEKESVLETKITAAANLNQSKIAF